MKKIKMGVFITILLCIVVFLVFQITDEGNENKITDPVEVEESYINCKLPYTLQVEESDHTPEIIAYRIMFDFMEGLESEGVIDGAYYTRFTKLSGNENSFVIAVVFQIELPEGTHAIDNGWGEVQEGRVVPDIVWKLTIDKVENTTYTLTNIDRTTNTQIGLPTVEKLEEYQKKAGIDSPSENVDYMISNHQLKVTYDAGLNWKVVPVSVEDLFGVSDQELIDGSYVVTPETTAFVLNKGLSIIVSSDKGKSWNEVLVSDELPALRMRILGFTSQLDGYLIVTGDKTMSFEANYIFKTNDGGHSWYSVGSVDDIYNLVTDGGFINDQLGFISFGEYRHESNDPVPHLYRTVDGGFNWERIEVPIPDEYLGYFTTAEIPAFQGGEGSLLVNQGPMGDYLGGKVLAKFSSQDQGKTWTFSGLVDLDGVLSPR